MNTAVWHTSGRKKCGRKSGRGRRFRRRPRSQRADVTRVAYLCYPAAAAAVASDARINCKKAAKRGGVFARVRRAAQKWISLTQRSVVLQVALRWTGGTRAFGRRESVSENIHSLGRSQRVCCAGNQYFKPPVSESPGVLDVPCAPRSPPRQPAQKEASDCEYCYWTGEPFTFGDTPCWRISFESINTPRLVFGPLPKLRSQDSQCVCAHFLFLFFPLQYFPLILRPLVGRVFLDLLESFSHSFDSENRLLAIEDLIMPLWEGLFGWK